MTFRSRTTNLFRAEAWCTESDITYDDGEKFNPDAEEVTSWWS